MGHLTGSGIKSGMTDSISVLLDSVKRSVWLDCRFPAVSDGL